MGSASEPPNESDRLAALAELDILDSGSEKIFDSITLMASQICNTPIAMIVLIDSHRQWLKAMQGVSEKMQQLRETPREIAFCAHTILSPDLLEVPDLTRDKRFSNNPMVVEAPFIRFYAGVPLQAAEGINIGTLCVLDHKPHVLNDDQKTALHNLAQITMSLMSARHILKDVSLGQVLQCFTNEVYIFDTELNCIYANQWYLQNLSTPKMDFFNYDLMTLFPQIDKNKIAAIIRTLFTKEETMLSYEMIKHQADASEIVVKVTFQLVCTQQLPVLIVVVNDINDKYIAKQIQHETILKKLEMTHEANRAKSQFLAAISHEISLPLQDVIRLTSQLYDSSLTAEQKDDVKIIHRSGENVLNLINHILDLSKIEAGYIKLMLSEFDLHQLIYESIEMFSVKAYSKKIILWADIADSTPRWIKGDKQRLLQIFTNLLNNAIHFTETGEICFKTKLNKNMPNSASVSFKVLYTGLSLLAGTQQELITLSSVQDESLISHLNIESLGMAITQQLLLLMDSEMTVESDEGLGCELDFIIDFEKCQESHLQSTVRFNLPQLHGAKILCVNAVFINKKLIQLPILSWQMQCDLAENFADALGLFQAAHVAKNPYNLILVDAMLPEGKGIDLIAEFRKLEKIKKTPIILMYQLGYPTSEVALNALEITATLSKPFRPENLYEVILRALIPMKLVVDPTARINKVTPHNASILVAEDDAISKEVLLTMLNRLGYSHLDIANNGLEAVALAKTKCYDIILMDCDMPGMDGYQATQLIRRYQDDHGQFSPVVAVTTYTLTGDREKCLACGMNDYVPKPIDVSFLTGIMEKWLDKSIP